MLGVGYIIFRGSPFPSTHPVLQDFDYWVLKNPRALPRAFVPQNVQVIANDTARLARIESADFDPRTVAFTETSVDLPEHCGGALEITQDLPKHVVLSAKMQTRGMVVLADSWDSGWHAYLDDKPAAIFRVNHAIRGVVVSAGTHRIDFFYTPAGFRVGLALAIVALLILSGWAVINVRSAGRTSRIGESQGSLAFSDVV
jgi:uncharacterized membrane protein YfhO